MKVYRILILFPILHILQTLVRRRTNYILKPEYFPKLIILLLNWIGNPHFSGARALELWNKNESPVDPPGNLQEFGEAFLGPDVFGVEVVGLLDLCKFVGAGEVNVDGLVLVVLNVMPQIELNCQTVTVLVLAIMDRTSIDTQCFQRAIHLFMKHGQVYICLRFISVIQHCYHVVN